MNEKQIEKSIESAFPKEIVKQVKTVPLLYLLVSLAAILMLIVLSIWLYESKVASEKINRATISSLHEAVNTLNHQLETAQGNLSKAQDALNKAALPTRSPAPTVTYQEPLKCGYNAVTGKGFCAPWSSFYKQPPQ